MIPLLIYITPLTVSLVALISCYSCRRMTRVYWKVDSLLGVWCQPCMLPSGIPLPLSLSAVSASAASNL